MQINNPYHSGELLIQELAGETKMAARNGTIIADTIMPGALPFLRQQQMLVVASSSPEGELWSSILFGPKGFVESDDGKTLRIHLEQRAIDFSDPFWKDVASDPRVGALAIELASRRRLRINGHLIGNQPALLTIAVDEAYPNCPKYIQRRLLKLGPAPSRELPRLERGTTITGEIREIVAGADTMFVASSNPNGGTDVSHRGGRPGFVTIVNEQTLSVPDYQGNSLFNTLGNISLNPATGILIVDFANHRTLQITGKAEIHWRRAARTQAGDTGRSWSFEVARWLLRPLSPATEWEFLDYSPFNPV